MKLKTNYSSFVGSTIGLLTSLTLQDSMQIIMLVLSILSVLFSFIYTLIRLIILYKSGNLTLEELEKVKNETEKNINDIRDKIR